MRAQQGKMIERAKNAWAITLGIFDALQSEQENHDIEQHTDIVLGPIVQYKTQVEPASSDDFGVLLGAAYERYIPTDRR